MNNILIRLGKNIKNLVILDTGAIKDSDCEELAKVFPDRYFCFGLAESNMISAAAGFAIAGKLPLIFGNARFLLSRAFDEIYNDICLPNLNVKIVGCGQADVDKELVKILPNMSVTEGDLSMLDRIVQEYGPAYLKKDDEHVKL